VVYLGQLVSAEGVFTVPEKVKAISKHPEPANRGQLMSFLGMVNFYRKFVKGATSILKPLTDATKGKGDEPHLWEWTKKMILAFMKAEQALKEAAMISERDVGGGIQVRYLIRNSPNRNST